MSQVNSLAIGVVLGATPPPAGPFKIQFFQLTSIPGTWQPNSLYWIENGDGATADTYVTDVSSVPHGTTNTSMVTGISNPLIAIMKAEAITAAGNEMQVFADIATRDAATITSNAAVLVTDASADPTVTAGAAMYLYELTPDTFTKVSEFESLDVNATWAALTGKPTSLVADIDDAVMNRHTHGNTAEITKIGETAGKMTYDGVSIPEVAADLPYTAGGSISSTNVQDAIVEISTDAAVSGTSLSNTADATTVAIESDTGTDTTVGAATGVIAGVVTGADKTKLDSVEANAAGDQSAAELAFTPDGSLSSTNVQDAIAELRDEAASSDWGNADW